MMTLFPLTGCCERLSVDPKTRASVGSSTLRCPCRPSDRRPGQMSDLAAGPATGLLAWADPPATSAVAEWTVVFPGFSHPFPVFFPYFFESNEVQSCVE